MDEKWDLGVRAVDSVLLRMSIELNENVRFYNVSILLTKQNLFEIILPCFEFLFLDISAVTEVQVILT